MAVKIIGVNSKSLLKKFIRYPFELYRNCGNWVPALDGDEFDTFNPRKNEAYTFSEAECYLACKDGRIVGRVAAIVNNKANALLKKECVRFGWLDFIEDEEVLSALIGAVENFGRERGCTEISGPWGFTDMDKEGALVEGYDKLSPFTCLYNYPYYDTLLRRIGFEKEADWTQRLVKISNELPPMFQLADTIEKRYDIHIAKVKNMREMSKRYGMEVFHLYNESFAPLLNFSPLSDTQIKNYLDTYVPILDPDFAVVCVNGEDKPVGFAFCVPTLSKAVKKSKGRLFPFGFIRILRALKKNDTLEALLIGILPEYQGKGTSVLMFKAIHENCIRRGVTRMILNPQLEDNFKVQTMFEQYEVEPYMRRRTYSKPLCAKRE